MATIQEIRHQQELLAIYRRNLQQLLMQTAKLGSAQITTAQENEISDSRAEIARIKNSLIAWGIPVNTHPNDNEPDAVPQTRDITVKLSPDKVMLIIPIKEFAILLQHDPEIFKYIVYKS